MANQHFFLLLENCPWTLNIQGFGNLAECAMGAHQFVIYFMVWFALNSVFKILFLKLLLMTM